MTHIYGDLRLGSKLQNLSKTAQQSFESQNIRLASPKLGYEFERTKGFPSQNTAKQQVQLGFGLKELGNTWNSHRFMFLG